MIKWIILLIIAAILFRIGYKWLSQRYLIKGNKIKDVDSVSDKLPLDIQDKKFNNKKVQGKVLYETKNKEHKLNVKSVKSALKNNKKGKLSR